MVKIQFNIILAEPPTALSLTALVAEIKSREEKSRSLKFCLSSRPKKPLAPRTNWMKSFANSPKSEPVSQIPTKGYWSCFLPSKMTPTVLSTWAVRRRMVRRKYNTKNFANKLRNMESCPWNYVNVSKFECISLLVAPRAKAFEIRAAEVLAENSTSRSTVADTLTL